MTREKPKSIEFRNLKGQVCELDLNAEMIKIPYHKKKISPEFLMGVAQKAPTLSEFVYAVYLSMELRENIVQDARFNDDKTLSEAMSTFISTGHHCTFHKPVWDIFNRPNSISYEKNLIWVTSGKASLDEVCKFEGKKTLLRDIPKTDNKQTQYSKFDISTGLPVKTKRRVLEGEWMTPVYAHCIEADTSDLFEEIPAAFWCVRYKKRKEDKENYVLTPKNIRNFEGTHVLVRNCRYLDDFTHKGEKKDVRCISYDILKQVADARIKLYNELKEGANWRQSLVELPRTLSSSGKSSNMFLPDGHKAALEEQKNKIIGIIDRLYGDINNVFQKGEVMDAYWVNY